MSRETVWKADYNEGVKHFRSGGLDQALVCFTKANEKAHEKVYQILDSRAAVYEKVDRIMDALQDAKKVISIAPQQWHGYFRAARLFQHLGKLPQAVKMIQYALDRLPDDTKHESRRSTLLELQVAVTQAHQDAVRASTNYIAKLPVELLGLVFLYSNTTSASAARMSHVCRHWRFVALGNPMLWHSLSLANSSSGKAAAKVKAWIERSRGNVTSLNFHPLLSTSIFGPMNFNPQGRKQIMDELERLDWSRLDSLTVIGVDAGIFQNALQSVGFADYERRVRHLSITQGDGRFPHNQDSDDAFALRSLKLDAMKCDFHYLKGHTGNLVSIDINIDDRQFNDYEDVRQLLRANPVLETVSIAFVSGVTTLPVNHDEHITILPHLRQLSLKRVHKLVAILGHISTPNLQMLRLHDVLHGASYFQQLIEDDTRPMANLQQLLLTTTTLPPGITVDILKLCPSLTSLRIAKVGIDMNMVVRTLYTPQPPIAHCDGPGQPLTLSLPCPLLRNVDFSGCSVLSIGSLLELANVRINFATASSERGDAEPVVRLQSMILDDCPNLQLDYIARLRSLVPSLSHRTTVQVSRRR